MSLGMERAVATLNATALRSATTPMSRDEELLIQLTAGHVVRHPRYSFRYLLDDRPAILVGDAPDTITVRLRDAARTCQRIFGDGSLGLGDSYCEGLIEVDDRDYGSFLLVLIRAAFDAEDRGLLSWPARLRVLWAASRGDFFSHGDQRANIESHYGLRTWFDDDDDSNRFYLEWLGDPYVQYSSARWTDETRTLAEAQQGKFEHYRRRLGIDESSRGKHLLELGCGWGGFLFYMAERYGLDCTGITLCSAQGRYIEAEASRRGLADRVRVQVRNAHAMEGTFDHIASIGLLEHIDDYDHLFARTADCLVPGGSALFHAMFHEKLVYKSDPWLVRHIFPGGGVPNIRKVMKRLGRYFQLVDRDDLPPLSYPKTLACWYETFLAREPRIREMLATSRCGDVETAVRVFKHYLMLSWAGLTVDGLVSNILVRGKRKRGRESFSSAEIHDTARIG